MSAIAIYCQKSHDNAVVSNYDAMVQQLSAYCNNALVTVGPIVGNTGKIDNAITQQKISEQFQTQIGNPYNQRQNR
jgi:hypothetical protein